MKHAYQAIPLSALTRPPQKTLDAEDSCINELWRMLYQAAEARNNTQDFTVNETAWSVSKAVAE